ncbi:hypothetical protein ACFSC6_04915 [Rufibacter sediminis]|uniref:Glycosyltransferase RgtA/B/C/D-like domain-containing protein n=1 Tax=Rufibacter sediminis TaxID=2762756 RepID=A0ABR6VS21_9BACT|nr:hypothetical protein [Rufibacter sediminis]MBC3539936.1 hypothetical protein [Rufibacter sediminis]
MNLLNWLHLPVFFLFVYLLWTQARQTPALRPFFWPALFLKLSAGILIGIIYRHYFSGGDTWEYHAQTIKVVQTSRQDPEQYLRLLVFNEKGEIPIGFSKWADYSNSFFFIKLLSLFYFLTGNSYWFSGLYLSLFSFWGGWFLVAKVQTYYSRYGIAAAIAFLFFPSVVFWTSGVSKDSVFMGSLCLTVGLLLRLYKSAKPTEGVTNFLLLLPCVYLLWRIKFFLAAVLLVLVGALLLAKWLARCIPLFRSASRQGLLWLGMLGIGAFVASFAHPTFNLNFFARHILWNYRNLTAKTDITKPHLEFPDLQPDLFSVLFHAPEAVMQMLFRPYVWEAAPLFYKAVAVENLFLVLLVLITLIYLIRKRKVPALPAFVAVLLVFFCISAVLVTLPTPNLGSLHRYRAPLLPFLFLVVLAWGPVPGWLQRWSKSRG